MKRILFIIFCVSLVLVSFSPVAYSQESLADKLKKHVYTLADDSMQGRKAGTEFARKAADYIAAQWEEIGITPLVGKSYLMPFKENQYHNLVGIIEGSHPILKDEYIVVGAHYDHLGSKEKDGETVIYNGADDNASGTAAVIELGRMLKEIQPALGRSVILIAFDAEELGLYGSNEFARHPPVPLENVKLMLSVDMVGWYKTSGYLKYEGYGTIKNGEQIILNSKLFPEGLHVETQKFEKSVLTGTDTQGFAQKGIPTLAVTTGLKSPYHKPEDDADRIDYDGMALVTEHLANLVEAVSTDENYQASGKIASKHKPPSKFSFGISANMGSNYHHYTAGALDGKSAGACGAGLNVTFNMGNFAIRPEAYYDFIKARHPAGDISTHSVTVPLNFMLQSSPSEMAGFAVFAGPYYSYKFSGKQGNSSLDFENLYYRNEAGISYGIEMRVAFLRLGVTTRQAFTNFTRVKNADGAHIRNRTLFLTLSYNF